MKKRLIAASLCAALALSMTACGSKNADTEVATEVATTEDTQTEVVPDPDPADCVTKICEYKGIEISLTGDYAVSDDYVNSILESLLVNMGLDAVEVTDRTTVREGDYVNVDYTGYHNGVAFEGGAATDQMLDVSNNCSVDGMTYIDNFTAGVLGAEVGSTVSSDVTFPEDYQNEELAGEVATFEFVVKGIYQPVTMETLTDDMVAEYMQETFQVSTKEELVAFVRDYVESQNIAQFVQDYVLNNSEYVIPEDYMEFRLSQLEDYYAASYGDKDTMVMYMEMSGTSLEEVREQWRAQLNTQIGSELLFLYIAQLENMEVDEEDYSQMVSSYLQENGGSYSTEEDLYAAMGYGDAQNGEDYMRGTYLRNQALAFIIENATLNK